MKHLLFAGLIAMNVACIVWGLSTDQFVWPNVVAICVILPCWYTVSRADSW